jgi:Flagellar protein YcgR/PilZ domain
MAELNTGDIPLGQALEWPLHDSAGRVLLAAGKLIPDAQDVALLFHDGPLWRGALDKNALRDTDGATAANPAANPERHEEQAVNYGAMGLRVGTLLQVKRSSATGFAPAFSQLIGIMTLRALFITPPKQDGQEYQMHAGDTLVLRSFSGTSIHSFSCSVEAVCNAPFRYLVLSEPGQVKQLSVRSAVRIKTRLPAYVRLAGATANEPSQLAVILDLSTNGVLLRTRQPGWAIGQIITLQFELEIESVRDEVTVSGSVRNRAQAGQDAAFPTYGIKFDTLSESALHLLQWLICEQLLTSNLHPTL